MISMETNGGKKLELISDNKKGGYKFQFVPGGELPVELSGNFTQERYAQQALNLYLERPKNKKEKE